MPGKSNLQFSSISLSTGTGTIVAAQTQAGVPKFINIWGIVLVVTGATNLTLNDGTTALTGAMPMTANGSIFCAPQRITPWLMASPGNTFNLTSSASTQISGWVIWSL